MGCMSRRAFAAGALALALSGCGGGSSESKVEGKRDSKKKEKSKEDEALSFNLGGTIGSDASKGLSVNGVSKKVGADSRGNEFRYLLIEMTFENDLDHDAQAPVSYVSCYQNGVKLSKCTKYSDPNASKTLEPGYSIAVHAAFTPLNDDDPVKVKVKSSSSTKYVLEHTYPIAKLQYTQG